ncbi:MAG: hypothetical protein ACLSFT_03360 [Ruminococcus callidus]
MPDSPILQSAETPAQQGDALFRIRHTKPAMTAMAVTVSMGVLVRRQLPRPR